MREILFRGKQITDKVWVYGGIDTVTDCGKTYICRRAKYRSDTQDFDTSEIYDNQLYIRASIDVIPETVGQFTGLMDKNGRKIFEGDFAVLDEDVKKTFNIEDGVIRYGRGGFYVNDFELLNSLNTIATFDGILRGKIIGNIHDNPELLERREK